MNLFPLNWWPGNLRPYESSGSFIARFCKLNSISPSSCLEFFDKEFTRFATEGLPISTGEIDRIAHLLSESADVVTTVCNPSLRLRDAGVYSIPPPERVGKGDVFACPECAKIGFHSYLHEAIWLRRCPFHGVLLQRYYGVQIGASSKFDAYVKTLDNLFHEHCPRWPVAGSSPLSGTNSHLPFERFENWVRSVRQLGATLSGEVVWAFPDEYISPLESATQNVGKLLALIPAPVEIKAMLVPASHWTLNSWHFNNATKAALLDLVAEVELDSVIEFYMNTGMLQAKSTSFFAEKASVLESFRVGHKECRCKWELRKGPYYTTTWIASPEDKMHSPIICPINYALAALNDAWIKPSRGASRRWGQAREVYNIALILVKHDLISMQYSLQEFVADFYAKDAASMEELKWNENHICGSFLSILAEARFKTILTDVRRWLGKIEQGFFPSNFPISNHSIYIDCDEHCLRLFAWNLDE